MILVRKLHKWIGLGIGLQVAIWMLSGLVMGLLDHESVQGHNNQAQTMVDPLQKHSADIVNVNTILRQLPSESQVREIRLSSILGTPTYRVTTTKHRSVYDATSGSRIVIDAKLARSIAVNDYSGSGTVSNLAAVVAPSMETRRHIGEVWRVDFDGFDETSIYVSGQDGSVLERRNATWRLFDVFWMLHIMDYKGREDFNNALVIIFSLSAAWFSITGILLLFDSFSKNEFLALIPGDRWRKTVGLTIRAPHGEVIARLQAIDGASLYDELAHKNFILPSNCGGGGTCGLCVVELGTFSPESAADKEVIPLHKRQAGVRLSCQARVTDGMSVVVPEEVLAAEVVGCTVTATRLLTPSILEIELRVDQDEFSYKAGSFVHVVIPPHVVQFRNAPLVHAIKELWPGIADYVASSSDDEIRRAYSLASPREDKPGHLVLNVRFMPPPPGVDGPAGVGSNYMWSLAPGDQVEVVGPLGDFHATDNDSNMILVGGGAGMAPLRAIIRNELLYSKSGRRIEFWYGARSGEELFYVNELSELATRFENFQWNVVLSDSGKEDGWQGLTGLVHLAVKENVLDGPRNFREFEYYVCGPPAMLAATLAMLSDYGIPSEQVLFDDFGI